MAPQYERDIKMSINDSRVVDSQYNLQKIQFLGAAVCQMARRTVLLTRERKQIEGIGDIYIQSSDDGKITE